MAIQKKLEYFELLLSNGNVIKSDIHLPDASYEILSAYKRIREDSEFKLKELAKDFDIEYENLYKLVLKEILPTFDKLLNDKLETVDSRFSFKNYDPLDKAYSYGTVLVITHIGLDAAYDGDIKTAVNYLCYACNVFGSTEESLSQHDLRNLVKEIRSADATAKALKGHKANHEVKIKALDYYASNISSFKSLDNAAEQIAGKIVQRSFRTVRKWIAEYQKNLRSARTT